MIKKSLLICFILVLLFNEIASIAPSGWYKPDQNRWQINTVKTQDYLYSENLNKEKVIVGSSLIERIYDTGKLNGFYNLSFGGGSARTGLEILRRDSHTPQVILVEINYLTKEENSAIMESVDNRLASLRKKFFLFQEKYKPFNMLNAAVWKTFDIAQSRKANAMDSNVDKSETDFGGKQQLKDRLAEQNIKVYNNFSRKKVSQEIDKAVRDIRELQRRGTKIILVEVPMDKSICDGEKLIFMRKIIREELKDVFYIDAPSCEQFKTPDALHLDTDSAQKYAEYLFHRMNLIW